EAIGRPTLGAPTTAGAENHVRSDSLFLQLRMNQRLVSGGDVKINFGDRIFCAGTETELTVLVGDVFRAALPAIGIKNGNSEFTDGVRRKTDATGRASQETRKSRLPKTLVVDDSIRVKVAKLGDGLADRRKVAGIERPDFGRQAAAGNQR